MTNTNQHALLIGVGADLPCTVEDAKGLQKVLIDPARCGFPMENVRVLTGSDATRDAIIDALDKLEMLVNEDSTVIVSFSGHGLAKPGPNNTATHYLMPFGYDTSNLADTALKDTELARSLKKLRSKRVLVLLDCCHARGIAEDSTKGLASNQFKSPPAELASVEVPNAIPQLLETKRADPQQDPFIDGGRVVISSSMATEFSLVGNPFSLFTRAIIGALCGEHLKGRVPDSPTVTTSDLAMYAREKVGAWSKHKQTPQYDHKDASNFAVATYAAGTKSPLPMPAEWPEPLADDVEQTNAERLAQLAGAVTVTNVGGGAVAIGAGATAAGQGGVIIKGNNSAPINTGTQQTFGNLDLRRASNISLGNTGTVNQTDNRRTIDTGGGAYVEGGVNVSGGDFVGRDRTEIHYHGTAGQIEAEIKNAPNAERAKMEKLYEVLGGYYFSEDDLQDLAFRLNVDWDNLAGDTKKAKARSMVLACFKQSELDKLYRLVKDARPNLGL